MTCVFIVGDEIVPQLLFSETLCEEVDGEDHLHLAVDVSLGGSSDGSNFYSVSIKRTVPRPGSDGTVETITGWMSPSALLHDIGIVLMWMLVSFQLSCLQPYKCWKRSTPAGVMYGNLC